MVKEVISVRQINGLSDLWQVRYRAKNGLIYWKNVIAKDEMEAFMKVMGSRK